MCEAWGSCCEDLALQGPRAAPGGWLLWDVSIEGGRLIITGCVWEEAEVSVVCGG